MGKQHCEFCGTEREGQQYYCEFHNLEATIATGETEIKTRGAETISRTPIRKYMITNFPVTAYICKNCIKKDRRSMNRSRFIWFWFLWLFLLSMIIAILISTIYGENISSNQSTGVIIVSLIGFGVGIGVGTALLRRINRKANERAGDYGMGMIKSGLRFLILDRRKKMLCDTCGKPAGYYLKYLDIASDNLESIFQGFRCSEHKNIGFLSEVLEPESIQNIKHGILCIGCGDIIDKKLAKCPKCKTRVGRNGSFNIIMDW